MYGEMYGMLSIIQFLKIKFYNTRFNEANKRCPDPVNAHHRPDLVFGSVSEKLDEIISNYINKNLKNSYALSPKERLSPEKFRNMCYYRASRSLAEPGETVGLLAAQVFTINCIV